MQASAVSDLSGLRARIYDNPHLAIYYLDLGKALEAAGNLNAARRSLQQAIALRPNYAEAHFRLGQCWWNRGCFELAQNHWRKAAQLRCPKLATPLYFNENLVYGHHAFADPWMFWDGQQYRLYYTARSWDQPAGCELHTATSPDLETWNYEGSVLKAAPGTWLGSGSTMIHQGTYYLYYSTWRSTAADGTPTDPAIALATSSSGQSWQVVNPVVLEPDRQWYAPPSPPINPPSALIEPAHPPHLTNQPVTAWHHPYTFRDPQDGRVLLCFSANLSQFDPASPYRAAIGLAIMNNPGSPLTLHAPLMVHEIDGESAYGRIDRPQLISLNHRYYLFFSCPLQHLNPKWRKRLNPYKLSESTLFCYVADHFLGPYTPMHPSEPGIAGTVRTGLYGMRLVVDATGQFLYAYGTSPRSHLLELSTQYTLGHNGDRLGIVFQPPQD